MAKGTQELDVRDEIARVRYDIEQTRSELADTLEALGDKASPKRAVQRTKSRAKQRVTRLRTAVMGSAEEQLSNVQDVASQVTEQAGEVAGNVAGRIKDAPDTLRHQAEGNPLAAGLVAFGVGLMVASLFPATETERQAAQAVQQRLEPLKDQAIEAGHEVAENLQESARQKAGRIKETASDAAQELKDEVQTAAKDVTDEAKSSAQDIKREANQGKAPAP